MAIFYQIVPKAQGGYFYIGKDELGNLVNKPKGEHSKDVSVIFKTSDGAKDYINKHLINSDYDVEEVYLDEQYFNINI